MPNALKRLDYTFNNVTLTRRRNDPFHENKRTYCIDICLWVFQIERNRQRYPTEIESKVCGDWSNEGSNTG
jgi:hypothetical protein